VVLLYDSSDNLPLPVHLYSSMLAHLHANLNFAIYSLNNQTFHAAYRRLAVRLIVRCIRQTSTNNAAVDAVVTYGGCDVRRSRERGRCSRDVDVSMALVTAERH